MSKKNPSWGGRFSKKPSQIAQNFSSSVDVDQALYSQDIQGSIAYAEALMEAKVLSKNECNKIKTGLKKIKKKIEAGNFNWNPALEDVHMNIEAALEKEIGVTAKKLHTGRSRNDQVVTDFKLFLLERSKEVLVFDLPAFTGIPIHYPKSGVTLFLHKHYAPGESKSLFMPKKFTWIKKITPWQ